MIPFIKENEDCLLMLFLSANCCGLAKPKMCTVPLSDDKHNAVLSALNAKL